MKTRLFPSRFFEIDLESCTNAFLAHVVDLAQNEIGEVQMVIRDRPTVAADLIKKPFLPSPH